MQYLYLIHCRNGLRDFYKVGVANDVESRLAQLQTGNPLEMKILGAYGFDNAEIPERAIHDVCGWLIDLPFPIEQMRLNFDIATTKAGAIPQKAEVE